MNENQINDMLVDIYYESNKVDMVLKKTLIFTFIPQKLTENTWHQIIFQHDEQCHSH